MSEGRKRKREDLNDDYSAGIEGEMSKIMQGSTKVNTLDSDSEEEVDADEINKKKHKVLDPDEIEGSKLILIHKIVTN